MFLRAFLLLLSVIKMGKATPWDPSKRTFRNSLPDNWEVRINNLHIDYDVGEGEFTGSSSFDIQCLKNGTKEIKLHANLAEEPTIAEIMFVDNAGEYITHTSGDGVYTFMDWDNQMFTFYPVFTNVTWNETNSVYFVLNFRSRMYKTLKMGIFKPYPNKDSYITQFESVYARNVFPCFDEPKHRAYLRFSVRVLLPQGLPTDYMVLANWPQQHRIENSEYWGFDITRVRLPSYLYAFAILKKKEYPLIHSFNYFTRPINIYASDKLRHHAKSFLLASFSKDHIVSGKDFPDGKADAAILEYVIMYSLAWCESKFQINFIWPKLDFVFTEMAFSGMENPGLIFISVAFDCLECAISTIVHEIVHQWTGARLTMDSFDNIWITEGLTVYVTSEILQQLQKWNRIPWRSYPLNKWVQYYSTKGALAVIDRNFTAVNRVEGYWLQSYFYPKMGNMIANLDDFMGHTLLQCLGLTMAQGYRHGTGASFSPQELVNELYFCPNYQAAVTNYPSSDLNKLVREYLYTWIYTENVYVLELNYELYYHQENDTEEYVLTSKYDILCMDFKECEDSSPELPTQPSFAVTIFDFHDNILQKTFVHSAARHEKQRRPLEFIPGLHHLYVANMRHKGNFVVMYPDAVYQNFIFIFRSIQLQGYKETAKYFSIPRRFGYFVMDMIELSLQNKISMKFLFKVLSLVDIWKELSENRVKSDMISDHYNYPVYQRLQEIITCLKGTFLTYVKNSDLYTKSKENYDIVHDFLCRLLKVKHHCSFPDVDLKKVKKYEFCYEWSAKWNGKVQFNLLLYNKEIGIAD